jgi:tetratricopeptide (TPR) repeat protein
MGTAVFVSISFADIKEMYKDGIELYKNKDYQKSYDIFRKLFIKDFKNKNINFYLGLNSFELQKYDEALLAYERILIQDENALRVKLEYAKTLFAMKDFQNAKLKFLEIKQDKIPTSVESNINHFLVLIDNQTQRLFVNGSVGFSLIYEDNVNSGTQISQYIIPKYDVLADGTEPLEDFASQEVVTLSTMYDIADKGGFYLSNDFLAFGKQYKKYYDKNILLFSTTPKIGYRDNNYDVSFGLPMDRLEVEHEISTTSIAFQPMINYIFSQNFSAQSYLKYQKKFNQQEYDRDNDSTIKEFMLNLSYKTFSFSFVENSEDRIRGDRTDIDKDTRKFSLNYTYVIDTKNNFNLSYSLLNSWYDLEDDNFLSKRVDRVNSVSLSYNRRLSNDLSLTIGCARTDTDSNQAPFSNKKNSINFGITRSF